jgi:UDPglucose 6-dehydrogenase
MKISVIGTGYVGLVSGTCFSEVGHSVTCVDLDEQKIKNLEKGIIPIYEPGLKELVLKNIDSGRLSFTTDIEKAVKESTVIIIAVGTPQKENGEADLTYIKNVAKSIGQHINGYKVVVTKSTVPIGTNQLVKDIISETSTNRFDFDIASNPEFLREGSAVHDTMNMERAVIGVESTKAADILSEIHAPFNTNVIITNVETAEMIKYAANSFLATKISFINEVANLAEKFGADVSKIVEGMGADHRIGPHFLNAGLGYGGSCFPKDINALIHTATAHDYQLSILEAVDKVNQNQRHRIIEKVKKAFNGNIEGRKIALLGLAFKPNTDDMREAPSLTIVEELTRFGANVVAYDPIAMPNAQKAIKNLQVGADLNHTLEDADAAVIVTEWSEFKEMDLDKVKKLLKKPIIIDGRNIFTVQTMKEKGFYYDSIGRELVEGNL